MLNKPKSIEALLVYLRQQQTGGLRGSRSEALQRSIEGQDTGLTFEEFNYLATLYDQGDDEVNLANSPIPDAILEKIATSPVAQQQLLDLVTQRELDDELGLHDPLADYEDEDDRIIDALDRADEPAGNLRLVWSQENRAARETNDLNSHHDPESAPAENASEERTKKTIYISNKSEPASETLPAAAPYVLSIKPPLLNRYLSLAALMVVTLSGVWLFPWGGGDLPVSTAEDGVAKEGPSFEYSITRMAPALTEESQLPSVAEPAPQAESPPIVEVEEASSPPVPEPAPETPEAAIADSTPSASLPNESVASTCGGGAGPFQWASCQPDNDGTLATRRSLSEDLQEPDQGFGLQGFMPSPTEGPSDTEAP